MKKVAIVLSVAIGCGAAALLGLFLFRALSPSPHAVAYNNYINRVFPYVKKQEALIAQMHKDSFKPLKTRLPRWRKQAHANLKGVASNAPTHEDLQAMHRHLSSYAASPIGALNLMRSYKGDLSKSSSRASLTISKYLLLSQRYANKSLDKFNDARKAFMKKHGLDT